jgi:hypothetical protein
MIAGCNFAKPASEFADLSHDGYISDLPASVPAARHVSEGSHPSDLLKGQKRNVPYVGHWKGTVSCGFT